MSTSNAWAEFAVSFRRTRPAFLEHEKTKAELKSLITFKQLNLMHPLPMRGPLQAIFCRNVSSKYIWRTWSALLRRYRLSSPLES